MRAQFSHRLVVWTALISLVLAGMAFSPAAASSQEWSPPTTVWIEDSGHTVDRYFLEEWNAFPDLLGLPITEELERSVLIDDFPADQRIVQYFERLAIVYVPEADERSAKVQALSLGREILEREVDSIPPAHLERASCGYLSPGECTFFGDTEHSVRGDFLEFWQQNDGERLIGSPLSEEFVARDGYTTQYFENTVLRTKAGQDIVPRAIGRESARQANLNTERIDRPEGIPIYEESLFVPPILDVDEAIVERPPDTIQPTSEGAIGSEIIGPGPQQGAFKEIVVSVSAQSLWAYEGTTLVTQSLVSTGTGEVIETITPIGYYTVLVKYDSQTMEGTISDEYYKVDDVPWVMYFDNLGNAIHGTYWHNNFGTPMSHGCVNLPLDIAQFLYTWAPEGTAVSVIA